MGLIHEVLWGKIGTNKKKTFFFTWYLGKYKNKIAHSEKCLL